MTSLVVCRTTYLRRLGAAALLAGTALFGTTTGTVADQATACAAPPGGGFDREKYSSCKAGLDSQDDLTEDVYYEMLWNCCYNFGGEWDFTTGKCVDPADQAPAQLPRFPDLGEPTATLTPAPPPPPAGPIAPSLPPAQTG